MTIRVLLVDDHRIFRTALRALLDRESDLDVVADVSTGAEALRVAREVSPDVVVMDIAMPGIDGVEATRQLLAVCPKARVLALSTHLERHYIVQMLEAGASGYVIKAADGEDLLRGIRALAQNRQYFCSEVASRIMGSVLQPSGQLPSGERLGRRESEVLGLLAEGKTSQEIATKLRIAVGTVIAHRRNISRKLGLHTVAELTKYAVREGLTST